MNASFDVTNIVLETERTILRPWNVADLDDLYQYANVDGVGQMAGWQPHQSKDDSLNILNMFIDGKKTFAIQHKQTGKVIGSVGIEFYDRESDLNEFADYYGREIGYVLSKDYWGQGIMAECVNKVIDYCFNTLQYDFLLCGHFDFNSQSKRVQQKCGFVPYRKLVFNTAMGVKQQGVLSLLVNPNKKLNLQFSHKETLIYNDEQ